MSTKCSIAHGENFHFYGEALEDDEARYLELTGAEFTATHLGVTVKIPAAIWEVIRHLGAPDLRKFITIFLWMTLAGRPPDG